MTNVFGERVRQPNAQNPITMRFRATMCHVFHLPDIDATQIRCGSSEQGVLHFEEKYLFLLSVWSQDFGKEQTLPLLFQTSLKVFWNAKSMSRAHED